MERLEEMSLEQGLEEIGHKILVLTRNELYMKMRFMDVALSAFYYYVQDFFGRPSCYRRRDNVF